VFPDGSNKNKRNMFTVLWLVKYYNDRVLMNF